MAKVLGIGGVFYKAQDPQGVRDWYARVLGFDITDWGGASFAGASSGGQQWSVFPGDSDYLAPSVQSFMINLVVDDLDGVVERVIAAGVEILDRQDADYGRFAWVIDPAGVKVELWQPAGE